MAFSCCLDGAYWAKNVRKFQTEKNTLRVFEYLLTFLPSVQVFCEVFEYFFDFWNYVRRRRATTRHHGATASERMCHPLTIRTFRIVYGWVWGS